MYEIDKGIVYTIEQVQTETQTAMIKSMYGYEKKVNIIADKTNIAIGETANLTLKWQKFDVTKGRYTDDVGNTDTILLSINELDFEVIPESGAARTTFSSEFPGVFTLQVKNPMTQFDAIEVTVNAE